MTNSTEAHIKLTSISLEILRVSALTRTASLTTAAPVDEHVLFADINAETTDAKLLTRVHVLAPTETDGFFLKVNAAEGFSYEARLAVSWNLMPNGQSEVTVSPNFTLEHPVYSVAGLVRLADSQRHKS